MSFTSQVIGTAIAMNQPGQNTVIQVVMNQPGGHVGGLVQEGGMRHGASWCTFS